MQRVDHRKQIHLILSTLQQCAKNALSPSTRKAFVMVYLYIVLPNIFKKLRRCYKRKDFSSFYEESVKTCITALHPSRFTITATKMIAFTNILTPIVSKWCKGKKNSSKFIPVLVSSFVSGLVTFIPFQNHYRGKKSSVTLDLTLLMFIRASDTVMSTLLPTLLKHRASSFQNIADVMLFWASSYLIMWNWFFSPQNLPLEYSRWISAASSTDDRLISCCRAFRLGDMVYGKRSFLEQDLREFCVDHGGDGNDSDIVVNQPVSCDVLHSYACKSCILHALWRFKKGFIFAFKIYGSLNFIVFLLSRRNLKRKIYASFQSSAFLATFIFLCWYPRCLSRNYLLPALFPRKGSTFYEAYASDVGCMLCGLSCLLENSQRRKELALFVAPKALGSLIENDGSKTSRIIEAITFSVSFSVLVSYAKVNSSRVRGIMGRGLKVAFSD